MMLVSRFVKVITVFTMYYGRHVGRLKVSDMPVVRYEVMKIAYAYFRLKTNLIIPTNRK
jgi:hypothetical protein